MNESYANTNVAESSGASVTIETSTAVPATAQSSSSAGQAHVIRQVSQLGASNIHNDNALFDLTAFDAAENNISSPFIVRDLTFYPSFLLAKSLLCNLPYLSRRVRALS